MKKAIACIMVLLALAFFIFPLNDQVNAQTQSPTVALVPSQITISQLNQVFTVNITVSNVQNLWAWDANIKWDPTILNMTSTPTEGNFLTQAGGTLFVAVPPINGSVRDITDALTVPTGVNGNGVLATLQFQVIGQSSSSTISLNNISLVGYSSSNVLGVDITPSSTTATTTVSFAAGGAPAANAGSNQVVTQGTSVILDGSGSVSSGSNPTYTWSFTDGTSKTLTGKTATYTFSTPGVYLVTLIVSDSNGNRNSTVTITVQSSTPPVAKIKIDGYSQGQSIPTAQEVVLNGSDSYEANNGTIQKYVWASSSGASSDMADVVAIGTSSNATLSHTFTQAGTYNLTLTVFDATNLNGTTSATITVTGASATSTPNSSSTSTPTSTPTSDSNASSAPISQSTNTPNQNNNQQQTDSLPPAILAIVLIVTIGVLAGSTVWLRKRT